MTIYGELISAAIAAVHALRSCQHGEIADALEIALQGALEDRSEDLEALSTNVNELQTVLAEIKRLVSARVILPPAASEPL